MINTSRWVIAFIIVLGLHVGLALGLITLWDPTPPVFNLPAAAITLELGDTLQAPNNSTEEPAPVTQEVSTPAPKQPEPEPKVKPDPIPEPEPVEAPKPKIVIPKKEPVKKPEKKIKQEPKKPIETNHKESNDTKPAADSTSTASANTTNVGNRVTAPNQGLSTGPSKAQINWQGSVLSRLYKYKRYPRVARNQRHEGIVKVRFTLNAQGRVTHKQLVASSGSSYLDQEALDLLKRAEPLPKPPTDLLKNGTITLTVPIDFNLKRDR